MPFSLSHTRLMVWEHMGDSRAQAGMERGLPVSFALSIYSLFPFPNVLLYLSFSLSPSLHPLYISILFSSLLCPVSSLLSFSLSPLSPLSFVLSFCLSIYILHSRHLSLSILSLRLSLWFVFLLPVLFILLSIPILPSPLTCSLSLSPSFLSSHDQTLCSSPGCRTVRFRLLAFSQGCCTRMHPHKNGWTYVITLPHTRTHITLPHTHTHIMVLHYDTQPGTAGALLKQAQERGKDSFY